MMTSKRVEEIQDELSARRGRNDMKRWVFVDMSSDPIAIETCWLSATAGIHLGAGFEQGSDGRFRTEIAAKDFSPNILANLFVVIAYALAAEWSEK